MPALNRIALLLVGLRAVELNAEEPVAPQPDWSPIFAARPAVTAPPVVAPSEISPVRRQLAALLRSETGIGVTQPRAAGSGEPVTANEGVLMLEKLTVQARKVLEPPRRETTLEKFTRTGYLWEFSPTKRFMIGPRGDKVGLMFSFDW